MAFSNVQLPWISALKSTSSDCKKFDKAIFHTEEYHHKWNILYLESLFASIKPCIPPLRFASQQFSPCNSMGVLFDKGGILAAVAQNLLQHLRDYLMKADIIINKCYIKPLFPLELVSISI